jgi:hypothetical protein
LLVLIALHVVAVLFYLVVKRSDLIMPMISGHKRMSGITPPRIVSLWRAIPGLIVAAGIVWLIA